MKSFVLSCCPLIEYSILFEQPMVVKNDIVVECSETVGARSRKDVIREDIETTNK